MMRGSLNAASRASRSRNFAGRFAAPATQRRSVQRVINLRCDRQVAGRFKKCAQLFRRFPSSYRGQRTRDSGISDAIFSSDSIA